MATNADIIEGALRELQVIPETGTASPEQGATCLTRMNDMLQAWTESNINLGYFSQTSTTDTSPIPDWARAAVKANLAIAIASTYGAVVSPDLAARADAGYKLLLRKAIVEGMEPADMRHMPLGSGWTGVGYDITTDTVL